MIREPATGGRLKNSNNEAKPGRIEHARGQIPIPTIADHVHDGRIAHRFGHAQSRDQGPRRRNPAEDAFFRRHAARRCLGVLLLDRFTQASTRLLSKILGR